MVSNSCLVVVVVGCGAAERGNYFIDALLLTRLPSNRNRNRNGNHAPGETQQKAGKKGQQAEEKSKQSKKW